LLGVRQESDSHSRAQIIPVRCFTCGKVRSCTLQHKPATRDTRHETPNPKPSSPSPQPLTLHLTITFNSQIIGNKWIKYLEILHGGDDESEAFKELGLKRYCAFPTLDFSRSNCKMQSRTWNTGFVLHVLESPPLVCIAP